MPKIEIVETRKRGQLFAADMIVAILILTVALCATLHLHEFAAKTSARALELASNNAEAIAEALLSNATIAAPTYCFQYSNGTSNCGAFACEGSTHAARRMVECSGPANGVCSLEVRTCG